LSHETDNGRRPKRAVFLGITGTPGAGKSTLIGELAVRLITLEQNKSAAVLAVDPSSRVSGGALLGDRTRVQFGIDERRLYFRSQSSDQELGGVGRGTFQVCRLLYYLFDYVFVETVGVGQNEIEIQNVADRTYLILQPLAGDQIQFMKAGIMEVPDVFVLNKCDEQEAANRSYYALRASLAYVRPEGTEPPIIKTSARTGLGLDSLAAEMRSVTPDSVRSMPQKEEYFFRKWVRDEFGRRGLHALDRTGGADSLLARAGSFEAAQSAFAESL
ncbi:MAG: protein kinase, partial [Spirochaetia bacterium]|nr:protein kinase [Spirochaetia bacterium]